MRLSLSVDSLVATVAVHHPPGGRMEIRHSDELSCATGSLVLQATTLTCTKAAVAASNGLSSGGRGDG